MRGKPECAGNLNARKIRIDWQMHKPGTGNAVRKHRRGSLNSAPSQKPVEFLEFSSSPVSGNAVELPAGLKKSCAKAFPNHCTRNRKRE